MGRHVAIPDLDPLVRGIRKLIKTEAKQYESDFYIGTVTHYNPENIDETEITLSNGEIVPCNLLTFSMFCRERYLQIPFDDENQHTHTMEEALGDITIMAQPAAMVAATGAPVSGTISLITSSTWADGDWDENLREWTGGKVKVMSQSMGLSAKLSLAHKHKINMSLPKIMLWRGIREGDNVLMLKLNAQQYHVLERLSFDAAELEVSGEILNPKPEE